MIPMGVMLNCVIESRLAVCFSRSLDSIHAIRRLALSPGGESLA